MPNKITSSKCLDNKAILPEKQKTIDFYDLKVMARDGVHINFRHTGKPVLSGHSKIDKTKVFKPCGSSMQFKSTAECSSGVFCYTFDLH